MALVQVGTMALRSPSGEFLPSEPIYREIAEDQESQSEYLPLDELAEVFADKFKAYKAAKSRRKKKENT